MIYNVYLAKLSGFKPSIRSKTMDKEKEIEIERMAYILYHADIYDKLIEFAKKALDNIKQGSGDTNTELYKCKLLAEALYEAGYRDAHAMWVTEYNLGKETEFDKMARVRKETAKEIYDLLIDETVWETDTIMIGVDWLKDKIKKYGVEVDE